MHNGERKSQQRNRYKKDKIKISEQKIYND